MIPFLRQILSLSRWRNIIVKRMGKTLENKFFNILSSLDSIWTKITIIGVFVWTGFKFGCYYKETQMKLEQLEEEKKDE